MKIRLTNGSELCGDAGGADRERFALDGWQAALAAASKFHIYLSGRVPQI